MFCSYESQSGPASCLSSQDQMSCGLKVLLGMSAELSMVKQTRDAVFTTVRLLVRGTIAHLGTIEEKHGKHFATAKDCVTKLCDGGNTIAVPTNEQVDIFEKAVYKLFLATVIED
ncbi:hypothetical protein DPMN_073684 [Dreissena polymorpha]|uniref:Uncharacterized protein n=1 Tax=Dreissena polymorpha TaxID=45954 RepID=A0A9D4BZJ9_DREPO|nr:hypothetical protein DPMN_073684 [Dreissena polymorpha]